jgi:hypothetical protein
MGKRYVMPECLDCTFIERRIDQLIDQVIELPKGSAEQERIDLLITELEEKLIDHLEGTPSSGHFAAAVISN